MVACKAKRNGEGGGRCLTIRAMKLGRIYGSGHAVRRPQLHKRLDWQNVWQIVAAFAEHRLAQTVACRWLDISRSRLYQLRHRWLSRQGEKPSETWLHSPRSSPTIAFSPELQTFLREELRYIKEQSEFFRGHINFAFLAQECQRRFGCHVHRNTLRRWAVREGLYVPEQDPTGKAYVRFEMGGIGLLFQHDSSPHVWVPHMKQEAALIMTIDDHSRKVVGARLVPHDTAWNHICVLRSTIETFGCPVAYYTDNHLLFAPVTDANAQFSRILQTLQVQMKYHRKRQPQAKGKVEKRFDYFQRRVPNLCERHNVTNLTDANKILDDQVAFYNEHHVHAETQEIPDHRWKRAQEEGRTFLRPAQVEGSWDILFALHYKRQVKKDGTIQFAGKIWQIENAPRYGWVSVVLRPPSSSRRPHTEIFVLHENSTLKHIVLADR